MSSLSNLFSHFALLTTIAAVIADATPSNSSSSRHAARSTTSADGSFDGCLYHIDGVGSFGSHFAFDFTALNTLPDEFIPSTYQVGPGPYAPYAHIFDPENIILGSGQPMQMLVPGGQTTDPLSTCQFVTRYDDVLYASVRTVAQVSPVNGTVHGFFMYMNDTQETDIEIRTGDTGRVHFTNQQTHPGNGETTYSVAGPSDMTTAFHEYRYDWLPTGTNFYIDGVLVMSISRNNPSTAGWLMWNQWSNGYAWTYGPPLQDNVLLIRSVEAYFNRTSVNTLDCEASAATTTSVALTTSHASPATEIKTSQTDDGTSVSTSTNTVEITNISAQTKTTTGTVPESTDATPSPSATPTAYPDGSTPVIAGVSFSVETDTLYSGTLLNLPSKRSAASVAYCLSTCAGNSACTGTAFYSDSHTCSYYSSFDKSSKTTDEGSTFAAVQARNVASSSPTSAAAASSTVLLSSTVTSTPTPSVGISCPASNNTVYTDQSTKKTFRIECGMDHAGGDLSMVYVSDLAGCIAACASTKGCVDVSLSGAACYMKEAIGAVVDGGGILGARLVTASSSSTSKSTTSSTSKPKSGSTTKSKMSSTSAGAAAAAYTRPSFEQLLQLHIDARLVVPGNK